ncbi:MAG: NADH-quinone oxidoreductase subunit L [Deltaproteobacteria bacterium]|nr:NADH-quinone oxidoreductase subunit L [Deltaproteobacteria bacterium]
MHILIPGLPLLAFVINGLFGRILKTRAAYVSIGAVVLSCVLSLVTLGQVLAGSRFYGTVYEWIGAGNFRVSIGLNIDPLSAAMIAMVTFVASLIHIYSVGYMHGDRGVARFFAYLSLFTFSMLVLVLANNFLLLYLGWEAVGLCSYLLIGFWYEKKSAADAGKKAFVVNRVGDFGFGLGVMLIFVTFGSLDYHTVFAGVPGILGRTLAIPLGVTTIQASLVTVICLLLFVGAMGKSAQFPLHVWLPDAMEGPTPVSALIHAATMVTAGVYMVARANPLFAESKTALMVVGIVGGFTAFFAATIALAQNDIKRVLAYSTVSQLGYMFLALGIGAWTAAIFHLLTHAFFKALLFLGSGAVIHAMSGEQDMRKMGALRKKIPWTYWTFIVATLAISGIPPFAGFFSKDEILWKAFSYGTTYGMILYVLGASAALLTAFYMFRLIFLTFHGESRVEPEPARHLHESPWNMVVPLVVLALFSAIAGFAGVPEVWGGANRIHHFLGPVFGHGAAGGIVHASAAGLEQLMAGVSVLIASAGILLAWWMYIANPALPGRVASALGGLYRAVLNKWYCDEIYDALLVNPCKRFGTFLWEIIDAGLIDGIVNGTAALVHFCGERIRRLQTGHVENYALFMVLGIVVILGFYLLI